MEDGDDARILPVTCDRCESGPVHALRRGGRVVIRCARCGAEIFDYEEDQNRPEGVPATPLARETVKLAQVGAKTRGLYDYIRTYMAQTGYAPSISEMCGAMRLKSASSVTYHLDRLVEVGLIERDYAVSRGIRLVERAA
jgi:DNA-binding transcriptional ArsR family regulator